MNKTKEKDLIKGIKPFVELFDTKDGVYFRSTPNTKVDTMLTGIVAIVDAMVAAGCKLDDITGQIRFHVARSSMDKIKLKEIN